MRKERNFMIMRRTKLENLILEKMEKGTLDGVVGSDFETGNYAKVTFRKVIKDGVPQIIRFGASSKYFNNKESVRKGKQSVELFETVSEKLFFLQRYGFLIDDPDVKKYSALYKPKK